MTTLALESPDGERLVILGEVAGVFGVRGWIKIRSHTAPPENILDYPRWWLGTPSGWQRRTLEAGQPHGTRIIGKLAGCDDPAQAAALMGTPIAVPRADLPQAEADEYYWTDLEGLTVETLQGVELGRVDHLFETGSNDVIVVRGARELLIPFIAQAVIRVDLAARRIVVDWDVDA